MYTVYIHLLIQVFFLGQHIRQKGEIKPTLKKQTRFQCFTDLPEYGPQAKCIT